MIYSGRGKVILLGEHAVVYGYPALAVALDRGAHAERLPGPPLVSFPQFGLSFDPRAPEAAPGLPRTIRAIEERAKPLADSLTVRFSLPTSRGLGTSAALGVAVARALLDAPNDGLGTQVEYAAQASEESFHGKPSGLDLTTSLHGGALSFTKQSPPRVVPHRAGAAFSLILADTGARAPTAELVGKINALRQQNTCHVDDIFERIGVLSQYAAKALTAGDLVQLGALMNENGELLARLGLSTERLDAGCTIAKQAGALGAKLTGAGGGGALVALSTPAQAPVVRAALQQAGFSLVEADADQS